MDEELTVEQFRGLERLMAVPSGENIDEIPDALRAILMQRGFAHLRHGEIEITFDGIRYLLARR